MRAVGAYTLRNSFLSFASIVPLLPMRNCLDNSARKGSAAKSLALTSRCSPVAVSVTTIAGRRAARSTLSSLSVSSFTAIALIPKFVRRRHSSDLLDEDADGAAAGQADIPGSLVGNTEFEHLRFAARNHVQRLGDDSAFNAPARNRAQKSAFIVDDEAGSGRPGRRTPGLDHGGKRDAMARLLPVLSRLENVFVAIEHVRPFQ